MTVVSSKGLTLPGSRDYFLANLEYSDVSTTKLYTKLINPRCSYGKLSNIDIFEDISVPEYKVWGNCRISFEEKLRVYKKSTENVQNKYVSEFLKRVKDGKINTRDVDFTYTPASILHYGYYSSTYPKYFVPIGSDNVLLTAQRGEKTVSYKALGYVNNIETSDTLFTYNKDYMNI